MQRAVVGETRGISHAIGIRGRRTWQLHRRPGQAVVAWPHPHPDGISAGRRHGAGISVAAPASWVTVNLANETIQSAANKLNLHGISAATIVQDIESAQKLHAVLVVDLKAAVDSPQHFTPDLSAFCSASGVTDAGAAGVPILKTLSAAEFAKVGATHITQQDLEIGGVPGVETSYQLSSSSAGTIYQSLLEVLPKPDQVCDVSVTGESEGDVVSVAAATGRFP